MNIIKNLILTITTVLIGFTSQAQLGLHYKEWGKAIGEYKDVFENGASYVNDHGDVQVISFDNKGIVYDVFVGITSEDSEDLDSMKEYMMETYFKAEAEWKDMEEENGIEAWVNVNDDVFKSINIYQDKDNVYHATVYVVNVKIAP